MKKFNVVVTSEGKLQKKVVEAASMSAVEAKYKDSLKSVELAGKAKNFSFYVENNFVDSKFVNLLQELADFFGDSPEEFIVSSLSFEDNSLSLRKKGIDMLYLSSETDLVVMNSLRKYGSFQLTIERNGLQLEFNTPEDELKSSAKKIWLKNPAG